MKVKKLKKSIDKNKEQENIQELFFKKMPIGCILWDEKFRAKLWNPAAEKIFGYSTKEALGKHPYDIIVPKSAQKQVTTIWRRLLQGDTSANLINENNTKKGEKIVCQWINSPIKKSDGSVVGVLSMVSDVTEKQKYEKNILESQKRLASIIDFLPDATFVIDTQGKVVAWNKAIEKMSKMKAKDVLGKGNHIYALPFYGKRKPILADLVLHPELLKKIFKKDTYNFIKKEGEVLSTERFLEKVGEKGIYASGKAAPLYDATGKLSGVVELVRDITKEKELDKAKTEFVSMASHQLRTPLSSIKWTLESLNLDGLDAKNKEKIQDIYSSNERLIALVNNLLNITRIESGKMKVNKKKSDLMKIIKDSCKGLSKNAQKKKQKIQYIFQGNMGKVFTDPILLSEAFCNILGNAIDYGFEKSKITVKIIKSKDHYLISIHNFGPVITDAEKGNIFTKFYRGPGSPAHNFSGSGLGLFFTKATIEANGGKIWFESAKNKGTTFYFTVPIK